MATVRHLPRRVQTTEENSVLETESSSIGNEEQTEKKDVASLSSRALVLKWEDVSIPKPKEHEVKIRVEAAALTPYDISVRKGKGVVHSLPLTLGWDAVGEVVAIRPGVTTPKVGEMVAHIGDPLSELGTYAEEFILPANSVIPVPKELCIYSARYIASVLRSGLTSVALVNLCLRQDNPNNFWVLVHTMNNDIAEKLCSYLKFLGATVIATIKDPLKQNDIATYLDSLKESEKCLKRTGQMVYYMYTYLDPKPAPTFSSAVIALKSIFLSIPKLDDLIPSKENLLDFAKVVFKMVRFSVFLSNPECDYYEMESAVDAHNSWESGCQATPIVLYLKCIEHNNLPVCTEGKTHNQVYSLQPEGLVVPLLSDSNI